MKTTLLRYQVLIRKEKKQYVAYVPTLGISDFGKTLKQAQKNVKEAIVTHIEGLTKTKDEIPGPDTGECYISTTEVTVPSSSRLAL